MNEEIEVGGIVVNQCPLKVLGGNLHAVRNILDAAHFVEKGGGWPAPGGWADQTAACVDGVKCAWAAKREVEERLRSGKPL